MNANMSVAVLVSLTLVLPARAQAPVKIVIGAKDFTESIVLGRMLEAQARDAGAEVLSLKQLAGTRLLWTSLSGQDGIDAYVEYTGTLTREILKGKNLEAGDLKGIRDALKEVGILMGQPFGFSNPYALGMQEAVAEKLGITTISDLTLQQHKELKLRFSDEFRNRPDGWPGLAQRYGLKQTPGESGDHALLLRALAAGDIHITDLYSTDPEIKKHNLRILKDDKGFFPAYQAVVLMRANLVTRAPEVVAAWQQLEGKIDAETMLRLNAAVLVDGRGEGEVAVGFINKALGKSLSVPAGDGFWGRLLSNGAAHLYLVAVSLLAAVLIAVPLGVLAYKVPSVGYVVLGVVSVVQTLPSLALMVFLLPLFKMGAGTAIAALFLYSLLPIVRNTYTGLTNILPGLKESGLVLGLPWYARLWRIELPLASPSILAGIKIAAVINVGTATIGALVGAGGYGQPILAGVRLDDVGLILQGAIPAALLALLVQGAFSLAELRLVPRGLRLKAAQ